MILRYFPSGAVGKESACQRRRCKRHRFKKETATHSSILAWKIPWTEDPGWLQFMGHKELDTTERLSIYSEKTIIEKTRES